MPAVLALALVALAQASLADRLVVIQTREAVVGGVHVAEVLCGGQVVIRLRSRTAAPRARADRAADALSAALLARFARPDLSVTPTPNEEAAVRAGGTTIVVADRETAKLSNSTAPALAAGWVKAIRAALKEPYLALGGDTSILVPIGESRYLRYGGPLGKTLRAASSAPDVARVAVEATQRRLSVSGASRGAAIGTLHTSQVAVTLRIEAKKWAALIPASATGTLTGQVHAEDLARRVVANAALCGVAPEPGADVEVTSIEGAEPTYSVTVVASGEEYIEAKRAVAVAIRRAQPPDRQPVDVLVSNSPERIPSRGCLMREQIDATRPVRLLYHHLNASGEPLLFVIRVTNTGRECGTVHVSLGEAGPDVDELSTGHAAAKRFWEQLLSGSGYLLQVPPSCASDIVRTPIPSNTIVSGLGTITPLTPGPLYVEICAERPQAVNRWLELTPEKLPETPRLSNFRFGASKVIEAQHEIGGKWTFITIGREGSVSDAGHQLAGDYGVLHEVAIGLVNPTPNPGKVEITVRASGGLMRGFFLIDGVLHETGILRGFGEELLTKEEVPPKGGRIMRLVTMPESASNYPIHLVVRSTTS